MLVQSQSLTSAPQTPAAQAKGLRTFRKIEDNKCDADSCPLKEPTVEQKTFAEACDKYAGTVSAQMTHGTISRATTLHAAAAVRSAVCVQHVQLARGLHLPCCVCRMHQLCMHSMYTRREYTLPCPATDAAASAAVLSAGDARDSYPPAAGQRGLAIQAHSKQPCGAAAATASLWPDGRQRCRSGENVHRVQRMTPGKKNTFL